MVTRVAVDCKTMVKVIVDKGKPKLLWILTDENLKQQWFIKNVQISSRGNMSEFVMLIASAKTPALNKNFCPIPPSLIH